MRRSATECSALSVLYAGPHLLGVVMLWFIHRYGFATCSTLKPTQWSYPSGSINQIPGTATICGDCRITPFYDVEQVGDR